MTPGRLLCVGILLFGVAVAALAQEDYIAQDDAAQGDDSAYEDDPYCECVPFFQCDENNTIITDGGGIFTVRQRLNEKRVFDVPNSECPREDENNPMRCCNIPPKAPEPRPVGRLCGTRGSSAAVGPDAVAKARIQGGSDLSFGELPWMLVVLKKTEVAEIHSFKCGASLIHPQVALTAAHCVCKDRDVTHYIVRAGEYDTSGEVEALPHQDRLVSEIVVPENYNSVSLYHDFALLRLEQPLTYDEHIAPICLPEKTDVFDGAGCMASGWGRNSPGGLHNSVLRKVDLTIVGAAACQAALRTTRLGRRFLLDPSFVCAQGKDNADTCEGDGGSPLMCPLRADPTRWVQTGITAWGIGCGSELPAAYANVAKGRHWIDQQLLAWGYDLDDVPTDVDRLDATIQHVFAQNN